MKYYKIYIKSIYIYYRFKFKDKDAAFTASLLCSFVVNLHIVTFLDLIGKSSNKIIFIDPFFQIGFVFLLCGINNYLLKKKSRTDEIKPTKKTVIVIMNYVWFSGIFLLIYIINFAERLY